ncbi:hypothetical protein ACVISU_006939 [Bradyrhizobium sp. USDA 4452]
MRSGEPRTTSRKISCQSQRDNGWIGCLDEILQPAAGRLRSRRHEFHNAIQAILKNPNDPAFAPYAKNLYSAGVALQNGSDKALTASAIAAYLQHGLGVYQSNMSINGDPTTGINAWNGLSPELQRALLVQFYKQGPTPARVLRNKWNAVQRGVATFRRSVLTELARHIWQTNPRWRRRWLTDLPTLRTAGARCRHPLRAAAQLDHSLRYPAMFRRWRPVRKRLFGTWSVYRLRARGKLHSM